MNLNKRKNIKKVLKMKKCKYCHSTDNLTIDHKHPLYLGGTNDVKNLQCLCERCNTTKGHISENHLKQLWKFVYQVDRERIAKGKKPRFHKTILQELN